MTQRLHPANPKLGEVARDLDAGLSLLDAALLPLQPVYLGAHATGEVEWSATTWTPVHRQGTWVDDAAAAVERVGSTIRFQRPGTYMVRASFALALNTAGSWAVRLRDTRLGRTHAAALTPLEAHGRFGLDALLRLHAPASLTLEYCTDGAADPIGGGTLDGEPDRVGSLWVARI
jgi:hypothetical protein